MPAGGEHTRALAISGWLTGVYFLVELAIYPLILVVLRLLYLIIDDEPFLAAPRTIKSRICREHARERYDPHRPHNLGGDASTDGARPSLALPNKGERDRM